ncbi:putative colanic acid biosynthesis acetyltransferase [Oleiharenicola lentus]|uniref:putative colanic acid biosynthesis acetyltransferase n=1 Tax=Oleiharenicola lentus TaxID=2508720 RepID=UPI003F6793FD
MSVELHTHNQASAYASPWTLRRRLTLLVWDWTWALTCAWTPKPCNRWRLLVLKLFGAEIHGTPFVHQRARIQQPANLVLHDRACLGDGAVAYSLDQIVLHEGATIAQEVYLCTGTHDFSQKHIPLQTAPIVVERGAFVGARAFIMPGLTLSAGCVVGAMSVVTRDVPARTVVAGNPARARSGHALRVAGTNPDTEVRA